MLVKCRECGEMISDLAKACPHCGCPAESRLSRMKVDIPWKRLGVGACHVFVNGIKCLLPILVVAGLVRLVDKLDKYYSDSVSSLKAAVDLGLGTPAIRNEIAGFVSETNDRLAKRAWSPFEYEFDEFMRPTSRRRHKHSTTNCLADCELEEFLRSSDSWDEVKAFKFFDAYTERRFGVKVDRGNVWNIGNQPFEDIISYRMEMKSFLSNGFAVMSRLYASAVSNLNARIIPPEKDQRLVSRLVYCVLPRGEVARDKDRLLTEYAARIMAYNFIAVYHVFCSRYHFTEAERDIIFLASKNGGMQESQCNDVLENLFKTNPSRAAVIRGLSELYRPQESTSWLDQALAWDMNNRRSYGQNTRDAEGLVLLALLLTFVVAVPFCLAVHYGWKRAFAKPVEWTTFVVTLLADVGLFWRAALKTPYVAVIAIGVALCALSIIAMLVIMLRRPQMRIRKVDTRKPHRRFRIRAPWSLIVPSALATGLFTVLVVGCTVYEFDRSRPADVSVLVVMWGIWLAFAAMNLAVMWGSRAARAWLIVGMAIWLLTRMFFNPLSFFIVAVVEVPWLWALFSRSAQRWFDAHKRLDDRRRKLALRDGLRM